MVMIEKYLKHFIAVFYESFTIARLSPTYKHGPELGISHGNGDKGRRKDRRNLKSKSCRCNFGFSGNGPSPLSSYLFVRMTSQEKGERAALCGRISDVSGRAWNGEEEEGRMDGKGWWPEIAISCSHSTWQIVTYVSGIVLQGCVIPRARPDAAHARYHATLQNDTET